MFGAIWGMAIFGIILDTFQRKGKRIIQVIIYLLMGWFILFALKPLLDVLSFEGFLWLFVGGLSYTLGVVFFVIDHRYTWAHGIWHLFVLFGSVCHYFTILLYV